ncbi:uncharacterized protein LOC142323194 [Lycorma delicatula]|uniref:uncharacterized protein LOC142323194 n=1 Tax=Lycorma delicatula TaxID=130591 RepID=UPI003F50E57E
MNYNSLVKDIINNDVRKVKKLLNDNVNEMKLIMTNFKIYYLFYKAESEEMITVLLNYIKSKNVFDVSQILTSIINCAIINGVDIKMIQEMISVGGNINDRDVRGVSPLLQSIKSKRNVSFLKEILNMGANVNEICDEHKNTILHLSVDNFCDNDDLTTIKLLLDYGADVNARNLFKEIPLKKAVSVVNEDLWFELISRGSNINEIKGFACNFGVLTYALAKQSRSKDLLQELIDNGADVNSVDLDGYTPLLLALKNNCSVDCIILLIENNADVNKSSKCRYTTPLLMAMELRRDKEIVLALINNGADVNVVDEYGMSPLMYAISHNDYKDIIEHLITKGGNINRHYFDGSPLMLAMKRNDTEIISRLINSGADINVRDKHGNNPVFYSIIYGNDQEIINLLIDKGADVNKINKHYNQRWFSIDLKKNDRNEYIFKLIPNRSSLNVKDHQGKTFLIYAIELNMNKNIILDIISKDANINVVDNKGFTPLIYAINNQCDFDVIINLLEHGANVNLSDKEGTSPLIHAFHSSNYKELIKIFYNYGADINACDGNGRTLLTHVLQHVNDKELVDFLIENGADINAGDNKGLSPLMYAVIHYKECNEETIIRLVKNNANVNAVDEDGGTALFYALLTGSKKYDKIIQMLFDHGAIIFKCATDNAKLYNHLILAVNMRRDVEIIIELCSKIVTYLVNEVHITFLNHLFHLSKYKELARLLVRDCVITLNKDANCFNNIVINVVDTDFIELLVQSGFDINNLDSQGKTPLMNAVILKKNVKYIKALLENGGNSKCTDNNLNTILHFATSENVINTLIVYGDVDVTAKNIFDETPLQFMFQPHSSALSSVIKTLIMYSVLTFPEELNIYKTSLRFYNLFIDNCKLELDKMEFKYIVGNISFYKFCCKLSKDEMDLISDSEYLFDNITIKELFPIYSNFIIMKIEKCKIDSRRKILMNNLGRLAVINSVSRSNYIIESFVLDSGTLHYISKYLHYRHIVNLFLASTQIL